MTARTRSPRLDLEERLQFELLIADLSSEFVNLSSCDVDRKIEDAQRRVCECLGLDLSALWQWSPETPSVLTLTHVYRSVEGPPPPERTTVNVHGFIHGTNIVTTTRAFSSGLWQHNASTLKVTTPRRCFMVDETVERATNATRAKN
jgi:hypothetical protein